MYKASETKRRFIEKNQLNCKSKQTKLNISKDIKKQFGKEDMQTVAIKYMKNKHEGNTNKATHEIPLYTYKNCCNKK